MSCYFLLFLKKGEALSNFEKTELRLLVTLKSRANSLVVAFRASDLSDSVDRREDENKEEVRDSNMLLSKEREEVRLYKMIAT